MLIVIGIFDNQTLEREKTWSFFHCRSVLLFNNRLILFKDFIEN